MRDRLIELLGLHLQVNVRNAIGSYDTIGERTLRQDERARLADHLLANGVIVPPCKVGDEVFFNFAELNETCPAKVVAIYLNSYTPSMPLWVTIRYDSNLIGRHEVKISADVFRLVCHYTQEEAEKALAERSRNGTSNF